MLNKIFKRLFPNHVCAWVQTSKEVAFGESGFFWMCTQSNKSVWSKCWYDLIKSPICIAAAKMCILGTVFSRSVSNCINNWIWNRKREKNKLFESQREVKTTKPMLNNTLISRRSLWSLHFSSSFFINSVLLLHRIRTVVFLSFSVWYKPLATFQQMNKQTNKKSLVPLVWVNRGESKQKNSNSNETTFWYLGRNWVESVSGVYFR